MNQLNYKFPGIYVTGFGKRIQLLLILQVVFIRLMGVILVKLMGMELHLV